MIRATLSGGPSRLPVLWARVIVLAVRSGPGPALLPAQPPFPATSSGPAAQVLASVGGGHPTPLVASFTIESQASVSDGSAGAQETGNGHGSLRRRTAASRDHCVPTATASWSASWAMLRLFAEVSARLGPRYAAHATHSVGKPKLTATSMPTVPPSR
jgi:hypothetical protein